MIKKNILAAVLFVFVLCMSACGSKADEDSKAPLKNVKEEIYVGDVPLSDYHLSAKGTGAKDASRIFSEYVEKSINKPFSWNEDKSLDNERTISFVVDKKLEKGTYEIQNGNVTVMAPDAKSLKEETYVFINTFLGWMYAGTDKEAISDERSVIHIPTDTVGGEAWIEEREAIVTLWNTSIVRGNSYNESTSTKTDILTYSDGELYEYIKLLKWCGFTGVQVTDMCASWVPTSGCVFVQQRIRTMAESAHSLGMNFTLWAWAANFDGFGWVDEDVTYDKGEYEFQYQNPEVVACFEKYYDIYASLSDVCDRMICHYFDPGNLETADDVGFFAKLLMDKVHAINPSVDFGISCWVDAFDIGVILSYTGPDVTIYEGNLQADGGNDGSIRQKAHTFATRLGTWSWNTCGMEIDQLAMMQYTPHIIRETYHNLRKNDEIMVPSYWSEMDSYHILNAFSLYCGGHLLIDPDRDLDELTGEVAYSAVGPEYADVWAEVLTTLEKARSGESWSTYWWKNEDYVLASEDYPAEELLSASTRLIEELEKIKETDIEGYYMPTPVSMKDIVKMTIPHLKQIEEYSRFRLEFDKLKDRFSKGLINKEEAAKQLYDIGAPVHEYNTIVGVWGQPEARQQRILILKFCEETGVEVPIYPYYDARRKEMIYDALCMQQKGKKEPVITWTFAAKTAFYTEEDRLTQELIDEGRFTVSEGIWYYLTDWQDHIYDFND